MIRLVIMLVVLAIGFGGGVYFAHKFPAAAATISAEEEKRFLEARLEATRRIKAKLDQLSASSAKAPGGSGFLSASQAGAANAEDVKQLRADTDAEEAAIQKRLAELK
jgi:hypothetical protein